MGLTGSRKRPGLGYWIGPAGLFKVCWLVESLKVIGIFCKYEKLRVISAKFSNSYQGLKVTTLAFLEDLYVKSWIYSL